MRIVVRIATVVSLAWSLAMPEASRVQAQNAVFHSCVHSWEDGDPRHDDDGVKNGILTWGGGKTHVTDGCDLYGTEKLVIQAGAVVKLAQGCSIDAEGRITKCVPALYSTDQRLWAVQPGTSIRIDGATITDVRDHSVGAVIPIDGPADPPRMAYRLQFNARGDNRITNSTIKYCGAVWSVGDMRITGNRFLVFGGMSDVSAQNLVNTSPVITDNEFELAFPSGGGSRLDLRGKSPVFSGNTVRSLLVPGGSYPEGSNVITVGLVIGPVAENMGYPESTPWGPVTGSAVVTGNTFETTTGLEMENGTTVLETVRGYDRVNFRATIAGNTFRGTNNPSKGTPGGRAMVLVMDADVEVSGNEVSNFATAFAAYPSQNIRRNGLRIHGNRFSLEGSNVNAPTFGGRYTQGVYVNAENNWWGDPSGPLDRSNADGLQNSRGKGIVVGDGVDYVPFVGGGAVYTDDIHIVVGASRIFEDDHGDLTREDAPEFAAGDSVEVEVVADFIRFRTAERGRVVVHLKDPKGAIIASSEPVDLTQDQTAAELGKIGAVVPANGDFVEVNAELIPDGESEGESSNVERFLVKGPRSRFRFEAVHPVTRGSLDSPVQGTTAAALIRFQYTLSTAGGNGRFEMTFEERLRGTNTVLTSLGSRSLAVPPGTDLAAEQRIDPVFPLHATPTKSEFFMHIRLFDDQGRMVASDSAGVNVRSPGLLNFGDRREDSDVDDDAPSVFPTTYTAGQPQVRLGRSYFVAGDDLAANAGLTWRVNLPGATGWQVDVDRIETYGPTGALLERVEATGRVGSIATTTDDVFGRVDVSAPGRKVPSGAARVRFVARLRDGSQRLMARDSVEVEVRVPAQASTVQVAPGAASASFGIVGAALAFTANPVGGTATAHRFDGPFTASKNAFPPLVPTDYLAEGLLPIRTHWTLFGTLPEASTVARVAFTYVPSRDFPADPAFLEDSLVVAGFNPLSGELEALPSTLDRANRSVSAAYTTFFETWLLASRSTVLVPTAAAPAADVPARTRIEGNFPNPFRTTTTLVMTLSEAADVRVSVYDLLGREVVVLSEGSSPPGRHLLAWDGRDSSGRPAASGVYLFSLSSGRLRDLRPAVLVR